MPFISVIALVLALASSSAWSSHPFESARDQYEAREDRPEAQLLPEATDHRPEVRQADFIVKSTNSSKQLGAPDLQVGCGDGFIHENIQENSEREKNKIQLPKKRILWGSRRKRSYSPLQYQVTYTHPYQSISVWQPPIYQLSRPYFIPIYGVHGRVPIYYPPQPIYNNIGTPKDNPAKRPFRGPGYLPPKEPTASSTDVGVGDRFNGGDNYDDRPVWGLGNGNQPQQTTERPSSTTYVIPTRRPRPVGSRPLPSLVHNPTDPEGFQNVGSSNNNRFTTMAPTAAPPPPPPTSPQERPPQSRPNEPSRCVWAIISCCSGTNLISYECFEQRGCTGAFWDNPCDSQFAEAAIAAALNYYNK